MRAGRLHTCFRDFLAMLLDLVRKADLISLRMLASKVRRTSCSSLWSLLHPLFGCSVDEVWDHVIPKILGVRLVEPQGHKG
mgnify:CR=1 FL=1|jgi:hypothetical protein